MYLTTKMRNGPKRKCKVDQKKKNKNNKTKNITNNRKPLSLIFVKRGKFLDLGFYSSFSISR